MRSEDWFCVKKSLSFFPLYWIASIILFYFVLIRSKDRFCVEQSFQVFLFKCSYLWSDHVIKRLELLSSIVQISFCIELYIILFYHENRVLIFVSTSYVPVVFFFNWFFYVLFLLWDKRLGFFSLLRVRANRGGRSLQSSFILSEKIRWVIAGRESAKKGRTFTGGEYLQFLPLELVSRLIFTLELRPPFRCTSSSRPTRPFDWV